MRGWLLFNCIKKKIISNKKVFEKKFKPYEIGYISDDKKKLIYLNHLNGKKNACVFISGKGSDLKNLISCSRDSNFPIKISLVISDNKNAHGIYYAKKFKIPYILVDTKNKNYENKILLNLKKYKISLFA